MEQQEFIRIARALSVALIDDFRGFLAEGSKRIEVPDNELHLNIAYKELSNVPGWEYESGVGQNPIVEYLQLKKAIYITKILKEDGSGEYQRTVGYLTDVFSNEVIYKEKKQLAYMALRSIAIGMGYDVDEYTLQPRTKESVKTPVSIEVYKGKTSVKKRFKKANAHHIISSAASKAIIVGGTMIGVIDNGRFYRKENVVFSDEKKR